MKTLSEAVTEGVKLGFKHARENPDATLEGFLIQIADLQQQLKGMTTEQLKLLADGRIFCYQCEKEVKYLFEDGRCWECTRLTPEEVIGE